MNKRWISILLAVCLMFGLMGCRTTDIPGGTTPADARPYETGDPTSGSESTNASEDGPQNLDDATGPDEDRTQTEPSEEATNPSEEITEPSEEATEPVNTEPSTEPEGSEDPTQPSAGEDETAITDYEMYHNMSGDEQKAFIDSFGSIEAFFVWYNNAKAEYEAKNPGIDVGDGNVNLGSND